MKEIKNIKSATLDATYQTLSDVVSGTIKNGVTQKRSVGGGITSQDDVVPFKFEVIAFDDRADATKKGDVILKTKLTEGVKTGSPYANLLDIAKAANLSQISERDVRGFPEIDGLGVKQGSFYFSAGAGGTQIIGLAEADGFVRQEVLIFNPDDLKKVVSAIANEKINSIGGNVALGGRNLSE